MSSQARKAVFFDRDGVLTAAVVTADGKPSSPAVASKMEIVPEAAPACEMLAAAGFLRICVTNQPEIARGHLEAAELDEMNRILESELGLDAVIDCRHDDAENCECRKPKPGMILDAARRFDIDLGASFTIGDRWRDIDAGNNAGTRTIHIERGYEEGLRSAPDVTVADVEEAARWIIERAPS